MVAARRRLEEAKRELQLLEWECAEQQYRVRRIQREIDTFEEEADARTTDAGRALLV